MGTRLEDSQQLLMIRRMMDEPEPQEAWDMRRRKLSVLVVAVAGALALVYGVPNMPGWALIEHAFKAFLAAIW
jgi:hypothetical protein